MSYRIKDLEALDAEVRRIGLEQVDRALAALSDTSLDEAARIHAVRKRCKKIRALARLVRPGLGKRSYRRLNRHFRDAARRVSDSRDAAVFVATYDRVCDRFADEIERRGTASIRAALTRRLKAHEEATADGARLERLSEDLEQGSALIDSIRLRGAAKGFEGLRAGFVKVHDRARANGAAAVASRTPEAYHEWRKGVKYHRHHLKLLASLWPVPLGALHEEASRLGELLGDAHDLAELDAHLAAEPHGLGDPRHVDSLTAFARRLRAELEAESAPLGERVFAEKGKRVAKRFAAWHAAG